MDSLATDAELNHLRERVRALEISEQRLRATLYSIGDAVIATDAEGRVVQLNPVAEALTGWSEAEAAGRPADEVFRVINEHTRAGVESPIERVLREGQIVGLANHTLLVARDDTEWPIADSGAPIFDDDGVLTGVVLVFRDQSAEREAAAAVEEAEQRFRTFFDNASVGKCMTAPDGTLLRVNQAFAEMVGLSLEEMQRCSFADITHSDDIAESAQCIRCLLAGEADSWSMDKRYIHKDGHAVWTAVTTSLQRDEAGEPLHFLTHIQDISARKRAELELRERVKELTCLQSIGKIVEAEGTSISRILDKSVEILPGSWLHVDSAVARIRFDDQEYVTGEMSRCVARQQAELLVRGEVRGAIELGYTEEHDELDEGPFLQEERALIDAVAERLGRVIERLELTRALERERETLEAAFDGIDDVIYLADPETYELLHANSPVKAIWGDDCIGRKCYEVLQGRDSPCPFCTNDRIFGETLGESYVWEVQNEVNRRWYRCSDKAVRWTDGRWVRFELAIDITAEKEAEQALRHSEERFRRITEVAPDMIYQMSLPDGAYEYVSPAAEKIFGYQSQEFIDNPLLIQQAIPPEWHGYFEREWQKLLADQAPPVYEYQIVHKSGEVRWLNQRNVVLHDDEGRPSAIWGIVTDVTEVKEAELALRQSKREIEVRNAIAEVFLTADEEEVFPQVLELVVEATGSRYGLFGFIDEEGDLVVPSMTRKLWDEGQSEDDEVVFPNDEWGDSGWLEAIRERELQHMAGPSSVPQEGQLRIERSIAAPIVHQDRVIGVLQVTNKPTEYTEGELELIRRLCESIAPILDARIEREQEEARRREAEEELRLKAAELERSNQELEQFAYVASHDLQEPLRMVASFTQLLAQRYEGQLDDKADMYIGYAVDGAKRMQQLINDLLRLSRVSTRGQAPEPTDCNEVVADVRRGLMEIIEENEAEVVVGELPAVLADASQLGQVFQNLIVNAVKFRDEERPRVEVTARREGDLWELSVADNGIGIDPEFHDRIFVVFQRLHERGRYPGSGIGLAIVKKIVERHGGRIWVESAPGEGTRFSFTMPAADALLNEERP